MDVGMLFLLGIMLHLQENIKQNNYGLLWKEPIILSKTELRKNILKKKDFLNTR